MKKVLALVLVLVLALGVFALAEEEKKYTIGMAQCNLGEPWRVAMNDQIAAEAAKYPMFEVIYSDAAQDNSKQIADIENFCNTFSVKAALINPGLKELGSEELQRGCKLIDLVMRPQLSLSTLAPLIPALSNLLNSITERREEIIEAAEVRMKYSGYIRREKEIAEKMQRLENIRIKGRFHYEDIKSLSTEARQKLAKIDPETMAQASRIPGVSPSDVNVLLVLMHR